MNSNAMTREDPAALETLLTAAPYDGPGKVSAIVLNWKRPENVRRIVRYLVKFRFVEEVIVWNNSPQLFSHGIPDPEQKINVQNSAENLKDLAKYKAASMARNDVCFYQDDDWYAAEYIESLYHAYLLRPGVLHTATNATNWARNWNWSFYNLESGIHAEFSWIGCGSFFSREMARKFYALVQSVFSPNEQAMADTGFSLLQNQPIVCCQAALRPLSQSSAYSSEARFESDRAAIGNHVLDMLEAHPAEFIEQPQYVVRSVGADVLMFSSYLPFKNDPRETLYHPEWDRNYLNQAGRSVSESEIAQFAGVPFTTLFGKNPSKYWPTTMHSGDGWGLKLLRENALMIECNSVNTNQASVRVRIRTDSDDLILTPDEIRGKRFTVRSTILFELVSESSATFDLKATLID